MRVTKRYLGYARVWTKDQSDYSIESQLTYLAQQARRMGISFKAFAEKRSGKDVENRPVLKSVIEATQAGDVVGFYDNSRLGRTTEENIGIVKSLRARGVVVQVGGAEVDPDDPQQLLYLSNGPARVVRPLPFRFDRAGPESCGQVAVDLQ